MMIMVIITRSNTNTNTNTNTNANTNTNHTHTNTNNNISHTNSSRTSIVLIAHITIHNEGARRAHEALRGVGPGAPMARAAC